ncbi:MAG: YggS family pyridoxal phosphate-dependent enzyme [Flavobacteriaceae bacterium]|tara:strand:- start:4275 stop:4925 length:651 start_codon:yes stop_codon:yes gene_type:complete
MNIVKNFELIKKSLPNDVQIIAVSKTKSNEEILQIYDFGHRDFGENRIQELKEKYDDLPKDIKWHMIGHVQKNKVKYIAPFIDLIHSVDSYKLLKEINKQGIKNKRIIKCLLQIKIAKEESKFGLLKNEIKDLISLSSDLNNINIIGLMGMATFTNNQDIINTEFEEISTLFKNLKISYPKISVLSIGMSNDYLTAIKHRSNMVRIGSQIFGERNK